MRRGICEGANEVRYSASCERRSVRYPASRGIACCTHVGRAGYIVFYDRFLLRIDDCAAFMGTDDEVP